MMDVSVLLRRACATALALFVAAGAARADGDAARGEKKFEECAACHTTQSGVNNVGPSLHGVFERKAGELGDFRFSPALKRSGIAWSADRTRRSEWRSRKAYTAFIAMDPWIEPSSCASPS